MPSRPGSQPLTQPVAPQPKLARLELPQRRVVHQDPPFELGELRRRVQPQLPREDLAMRLVGPQGLHLPAAAVQGEHQLGLERLAQRMLRRQRFELRDDLGGRPHASSASANSS